MSDKVELVVAETIADEGLELAESAIDLLPGVFILGFIEEDLERREGHCYY